MTSEPHMNKKSALTDAIRDQAIEWVLRQHSPDMSEQDWTAFTEWLEADDRHLEAYDAAVEADEDLGALGPNLAAVPEETGHPAEVANDDEDDGWFAPRGNSRWAGLSAFAAMLLVAIVFWPGSSDPQFATLQTEADEIRQVAIGPAINMTMNGNTEVAVDEEAATVRMIRGEASYSIESETPGALRVEIDNLVLVDYGTVFNVVRDKEMLRVAVTEGAVMIDPETRKIVVPAGNEAEIKMSDRSVTQSKVAAETVLAWQDRQLVFEDRLVAAVIRDVERNFGTEIAVSNRLLDQKITGVISLANDEKIVIADFAAVLGGTAKKTEAGWYIE